MLRYQNIVRLNLISTSANASHTHRSISLSLSLSLSLSFSRGCRMVVIEITRRLKEEGTTTMLDVFAIIRTIHTHTSEGTSPGTLFCRSKQEWQ